MANVAVIVAAGSGSRMQSAKNKVLLPLCGTPVIARTVAAFADLPQVDEVLVVCRPADVDAMSALLPQEKVSFVFGGKTRQESVQNAVDTIDDCDLLLIHDGCPTPGDPRRDFRHPASGGGDRRGGHRRVCKRYD